MRRLMRGFTYPGIEPKPVNRADLLERQLSGYEVRRCFRKYPHAGDQHRSHTTNFGGSMKNKVPFCKKCRDCLIESTQEEKARKVCNECFYFEGKDQEFDLSLDDMCESNVQ